MYMEDLHDWAPFCWVNVGKYSIRGASGIALWKTYGSHGPLINRGSFYDDFAEDKNLVIFHNSLRLKPDGQRRKWEPGSWMLAAYLLAARSARVQAPGD